MNRLKFYIPNFILSVLLVFSIAGISAVSMASGCLLSTEFHIKTMEKHGVYDRVYNYAEDYFDKSFGVSGIPSEIYMEGFDKAAIKKAVDSKAAALIDYLKNGGEMKKTDIDFTLLENNLTNYFDEFAIENNVEVNDEFKAQLDNTISTAKKEIESFTDIYMLNYMEKGGILPKAAKAVSLLPIARYGLLGLVAVCIMLMLLLNRKKLYNALYWIATSGLCSGLLLLMPCIAIQKTEYFNRLVLRTDYIYHAVTGLLNDSVKTLLSSQLVVVGVSAALMLVFAVVSLVCGKRNTEK